MKKKSFNYFIWLAVVLAIFIIYTLVVKFVDVSNIGPNDSAVGLSHINEFVHNLFGVNFTLYNITDLSSVVAIVPVLIFALIGVVQLINRKKIGKVDKNILALGIFYIATAITYLFFEFVVINRRPVLIDGNLEASYPSSTTILSLTFFLSVLHQLKIYIHNKPLKISLSVLCIGYSAFLVVGRLLSGVHWFTDIIGAILISTALLLLYYALYYLFEYLSRTKENNSQAQNE